MPPKGKIGGSTSGMEYSEARRRRMAKARERQVQRWERLAGPVTVVKPTGRCDCGRVLYGDAARDKHECGDT